MSKAPERFAELREVPSREVGIIREMIEADSADLPSEATMEKLAARLVPTLSERRSTPAWPVRVTVPALAIVLLAGVASIARSDGRPEQGPSLPTRPVASASEASREQGLDGPQNAKSAPDGTDATSANAGDTASPSPSPSPVAVPVEALRNASAPVRQPTSASTCTGEVELVDEADSALRAGDAARALVLVRVHSERCPTGVFVQERERIAIEALAVLGRYDAMRERARAFEQRYPSSPHLRRVRNVVGEHSL